MTEEENRPQEGSEETPAGEQPEAAPAAEQPAQPAEQAEQPAAEQAEQPAAEQPQEPAAAAQAEAAPAAEAQPARPAAAARPKETPEERAARIARAREIAAQRAAGGGATVEAGGAATVAEAKAPERTVARVERARYLQTREVTRRTLLRNSFFAGLAVLIVGSLGVFLDFFNLRRPTGFGGPIGVPPNLVPEPGGDPIRIPEGKFWLVNLEPGEGDPFNVGGPGGLLALWQKCPHLGCVVPWRGDFSFGSDAGLPNSVGWFRCPCHGSTYSKSGVRVFGPAPRSMDSFEITVNPDGSLIVNTSSGTTTPGGTGSESDNPLRAVPYEQVNRPGQGDSTV